MKRYYSHYTFIYPDIYLRNHIVEIDDDMKSISFYPFEREIERTEFYSGLLAFIPENSLDKKDHILSDAKSNAIMAEGYLGDTHIQSETCFIIYHEENI